MLQEDGSFPGTPGMEEMQAHLAAIVASSDDAIVSKDLNGIVRSWNSAAERIFGYTADEIVGRSILTIIPPDRHHEENHILSQIRCGQRVDHFQTVRRRKDGKLIDVSVTVSPIRGSSGRIIGASKIGREITKWKQLTHEREKLYDLSKAMAGEMDIQPLVQAITDVATELSGAASGAFFYNVTDSPVESYTPYTFSGVSKGFEQFPMRNKEVLAMTFKGTVVRSDDITKDPRYGKNLPHKPMSPGHLPVRSYLAVPVISRGGQVLGGLFFGHPDAAVFTDRAELVVVAIAGQAAIALENARLNRELAETAAQFQQLANSIPQLAWMARADSSFYWYNQRWYEFTGTTPEEMRGSGWKKLVDPAELPRVIEKWEASLSAGTPWEDTFPIRRHDGVFRWHLSRAMALRDHQGRVVSWFGTNTDITDQMTMAAEREQLLAAERAARSDAERVSRMKDEFLATLSHELRTPLNAILGWSHLLKRRQDAESVQQGLGVIERNARAQTQLIEDLLDMSRIISGKIRLDVQRVDLASVMESAVDSVMPAIEAKGLRLKKVLDPLTGPVSGDPNRLQQVVWNLLSNAVKFTPKSGRIEVLLERVNSHVEITVADTGEGIEPEFLPHVFERFRQADATTTRQYGGLGLGLSIVKHLVELHGGQVRAKSAGHGKGATFIIQLPLTVTRESDPTREHPTSHRPVPSVDCDRIALAGIKVLIVDDEPDARMLITRLLEDCKAQVISADSAEQAMRMIRDQKPDIIVSDIGMPSRDGYAFMREVRALPEKLGGRIPAIAMTAFARSEDRTRAMMAGYQVHMSKPVDPQELLATVASLMGRTGTAT